eukprot:2905770-Karenia_brevis.AAC.1
MELEDCADSAGGSVHRPVCPLFSNAGPWPACSAATSSHSLYTSLYSDEKEASPSSASCM